MSLTYEPSSEPLHISAKQLFLTLCTIRTQICARFMRFLARSGMPIIPYCSTYDVFHTKTIPI